MTSSLVHFLLIETKRVCLSSHSQVCGSTSSHLLKCFKPLKSAVEHRLQVCLALGAAAAREASRHVEEGGEKAGTAGETTVHGPVCTQWKCSIWVSFVLRWPTSFAAQYSTGLPGNYTHDHSWLLSLNNFRANGSILQVTGPRVSTQHMTSPANPACCRNSPAPVHHQLLRNRAQNVHSKRWRVSCRTDLFIHRTCHLWY